MSKADLKAKKTEDLQKEIAKSREELRKARFNVAGTKGLKNNAKDLRRGIARMLTEIATR